MRPGTIPAVPGALMLATLTDRRDFGDDWLLERKFEGDRCVARKAWGDVRLESRTAKDLTGTYPEVRGAVAGERDRELLLDGAVVAFDGGQPSFSRLQRPLSDGRLREPRFLGLRDDKRPAEVVRKQPR